MYTISPYLAEFLGTLIMCTIGCGVIANVELRRSKGHGDNFFTIAFGWGFAVTFGVYASHAYSGGHLYRAPSAEVIPEFEDTHATAAARAATYTPTGPMPVLLPEEVKANRSTRVVNRVTEDE